MAASGVRTSVIGTSRARWAPSIRRHDGCTVRNGNKGPNMQAFITKGNHVACIAE